MWKRIQCGRSRAHIKKYGMKNKQEKVILDACCGGRMFWYDKKNIHTLFIDKYPREKGCVKQRPNFSCEPDQVMDFTKLKFKDKRFKMVVFDPPHMKSLGETSYMAKKYGTLKNGWEKEISKGFDECYRVLDDHGVLIFKWNECEVPITKVLKLFKHKPLFGQRTGKVNKTIWMCFMKFPNNVV